MIKKLKSYTKAFIREDDGMEFLQFAIIVVLSVLLIAVIKSLYESIGGKVESAGDAVDSIDINTNAPANSTQVNP